MNDYDSAKESTNIAKHRVSLARARDMTIKRIVADDRFDYGEERFLAYGTIDEKAYCLVFTYRNNAMRPISLRRVHSKEMRRHVP